MLSGCHIASAFQIVDKRENCNTKLDFQNYSHNTKKRKSKKKEEVIKIYELKIGEISLKSLSINNFFYFGISLHNMIKKILATYEKLS